MRKRWLARALAGCLAVSGAERLPAAEELPGTAVVDLSGVAPVRGSDPLDRPTELPPFIAPPSSQQTPARKAELPARKGPADYNPSYNYLPDQNPGARQPPCPCLPLGTVWIVPSYFLGTTENDAVPPLLSGGKAGGSQGTLYGGDRLTHGFRSGMRLDTGAWLDRCQDWGIEGQFFFMESSLTNYQTRSNSDELLSRPYLLSDGARGSLLIGGPAVGPGSAAVTSPLTFLGAEANTRGNLFCEDNRRLDFLAGYRFVRMTENLRIDSASSASTGVNASEDFFGTENTFHGGQVGLAGEYRARRWYVGGTAKVAFGVDWEVLQIHGATRAADGAIQPAGLLAQPSNSGRSHDARFAVVPEADLVTGYQVTDHCRAFVGYSFLYVSHVARPGQAIDTTVSAGRSATEPIVGLARPARRDPSTEFWMQGIHCGVEVRY